MKKYLIFFVYYKLKNGEVCYEWKYNYKVDKVRLSCSLITLCFNLFSIICTISRRQSPKWKIKNYKRNLTYNKYVVRDYPIKFSSFYKSNSHKSTSLGTKHSCIQIN